MNVVVLHRVSIGDVDRLVVADQIDKDVGEAERSSTAENDGGRLVVDGDVGDDLRDQPSTSTPRGRSHDSRDRVFGNVKSPPRLAPNLIILIKA